MAYFLFGGETFYPNGGARDLMGVFFFREEAERHFAENPQGWGEIARVEVGGDYLLAGSVEVVAVAGTRFGEFVDYEGWQAPEKEG